MSPNCLLHQELRPPILSLSIGVVQDISRYGYGCDGFDSNCDEYRLIDECDEDQHPPDIDLSAALSCKEQTFATADDAKTCVLNKAIGSDDCLPVALTAAVVPQASDCSTTIEVTATATGCEGRADFDVTKASISGIKVDSIPPAVSCNLTTIGLEGKKKSYVDAGLTYDVHDECGGSSVLLEAFSTEELENNHDLVLFSSPVNGTAPKLFVQDDFCNYGSSASGKCKIDDEKKARKYVIRITGTDESGNSNSTTCGLTVGEDEADGPLFLLAKLEA